MAEQDVTHTLVKLDGVTARQINQNFRDVQEFVNGQVVHADNTNSPIPIVGDRVWNTAWGVLDHSEIASSQTISSTSAVDVTGLEVTWDAVADRRYRLHAHVPVGHVSGNATNAVVLITDSSNAVANFMFLGLSSATEDVRKAADVYWFWEPATTASATYKVRARTTVSSTSWDVVLGFGSKAYFYVEDVGPV